MSARAEALFEFFFKYKPFVFERGELVFGSSWTSLLAAALVVGVAVPVLRRYGEVRGKSSPRDRIVLGGIRVMVVLLLALCLLRPALVVATAVPQENFLGVVVDDSRSMRIADLDAGATRAQLAQEWLHPETGALRSALAENFKLRTFGFAASSSRVDNTEALRFGGHRTALATGMDRARQELATVPLAGIVVFTDGADNDSDSLSDAINRMKDAGVPVFAVGLGREEFGRDIEVVRVETPSEVLMGTSIGADVVVRQRGFEGQTVQLMVEDGGRILSTQAVELPRAGESTNVRVRFVAEDPGPRLFSFRIAAEDGEAVRENNELERLVTVRDEQHRILYFEGEPRHEVGFIRRALNADSNIALVTVVRSAENKFQRLIVDPDERYGGEGELFGGFPRTREELYRYSGLILGSVEADFFTDDQQRMIADFVSQRGGGLLALGGRRSFDAGGWAGTPVAEVLPVVLGEPARDAVDHIEVAVRPTLFGRSHPVVQLADTAEDNEIRWRSMPPLLTVNPLVRTKSGAATLLEGIAEGLTGNQAVLAYQRYGAGKAIALTVVDTWKWQMHYDVPLEDQSHETIWRQMLRWLVSDVSGQVRAALDRDRFAVGESVAVHADVFDDTYLAVNSAAVEARVVAPDGSERLLPMEWDVEVDGRYTTSFVAQLPGFHDVVVSAVREEPLGEDSVTGEAAELTQEFFGAEMNRDLLQRLADETGGRFYTAATVADLPGDITFADGGTTVTDVFDLWDMPIIFFLFVTLVGGEWGFRKIRKLV